MRLLFSKNNKIMSYLIRWGAESDSSHFAVEFDDAVILQSNILKGVNLVSSNEFYKHNEIVHKIEFKFDLDTEESIWQPLVKRLASKSKYDYKLLLYWSLQVLKHRIFGTPYPSSPKWDDAKKYMCIEIAIELPDEIFGGQKPTAISFMSPENLFHLIVDLTKNSKARVA